MKKIQSLFLSIPCKLAELNLSITLQNGQSFRWKEVLPGVWRGMIRDGVWSFSQDGSFLYCVLHNLQLDGKFSSEAKQDNLDMNSKCSRKIPSNVATKSLPIKGCYSGRKRTRSSRKFSAIDGSENNTKLLSVKQEPQEDSTRDSYSSVSSLKEMNKKLKTDTYETKNTDCSNVLKNDFSEMKIPSHLNSLEKYRSSGSPSNLPSNVVKHYLDVVHQYFHLDVDLTAAYKDWSQRDVNFQAAAEKCPGVRLLDQPPVENVFSFICSSNNNIARISSMVEKLCVEFGREECEIDGHKWFSFPTIEALADEGVETKLRALGFGYRAAYIQQSARALVEKGGEAWLLGLRQTSHEECRQQLRTLSGVGPKVADCISLMSLDKLESIPVDTHVFQIAARHYLPHLRQTKSVTQRVYEAITRHFQQLYGHRAGWAHSVLFSADLKKFAAV